MLDLKLNSVIISYQKVNVVLAPRIEEFIMSEGTSVFFDLKNSLLIITFFPLFSQFYEKNYAINGDEKNENSTFTQTEFEYHENKYD